MFSSFFQVKVKVSLTRPIQKGRADKWSTLKHRGPPGQGRGQAGRGEGKLLMYLLSLEPQVVQAMCWWLQELINCFLQVGFLLVLAQEEVGGDLAGVAIAELQGVEESVFMMRMRSGCCSKLRGEKRVGHLLQGEEVSFSL